MTNRNIEGRLPVDLTNIVSSAQEFVAEGQIQSLHDDARTILHESTVRTKVNGIEADVSDVYAEVIVHGDKQYARVFRYTDRGMKLAGYSEEEPLFGIVIDEDESPRVFTKNPRQFLYRKMAGRPVVVVDSVSDPRVNDISDVTLLHSVQKQMYENLEKYNAKKTQEDRKIQERRRAERRRIGGRIGKWGLALSLLSGAGYGGFMAVKAIAGIKSFDEKNETIPIGGTVMTIDDTPVAPKFSEELISNDLLREEIPGLIYKDNNGSKQHRQLHVDQDVREVWLRSSEEGKNCEIIPIRGDQLLDDRLIAWTDFVSEDGTIRADELSVDLNMGSAAVCFVGQETSDNDDPRVVLKLVHANDPLAQQ